MLDDPSGQPDQDGAGSRSDPSLVSPSPATLDFALLRGALEEIPFGVATTRGGTILYANEALCRIFGLPQGGLENKHLSQLFTPQAFGEIAERLAESRSFDGRVATRSFDGRAIDAEVHIEWYSSEAQGVGGFLVVRDVSTELGALGRMVDQLGGALFRVRVPDAVVEMVSPAILRLTGLDAATCIHRPVLLTALVSVEERERVTFLYRRLARGEMTVASAQVSVKRPDGTVRVLQIRATCRRDTTGVVRHLDGVVTDAVRELEGSPDGGAPEPRSRSRAIAPHAPSASGSTPGQGRLPHGSASASAAKVSTSALRLDAGQHGGHPHAAGQHGGHPHAPGDHDPRVSVALELSHELLRETSQLLHTLGRELRSIRTELGGEPGDTPKSPAVVAGLSARVEAAVSAAASAAALNRGARRVLASTISLGAPLSEVLDNVNTLLGAVLGERAVAVDPGDAATVMVPERVEELAAALIYLSLRAYRFAGSGNLRLVARRVDPRASKSSEHPIRTEPRARNRLSRGAPDRVHVTLEILGTAPADLADTAVEISSDMLRAIPRPVEADATYQATQALLAAIGGAIESDDATFSTARTVIRLRM
jgi:PAS domain S-box-containing protein